MFVVTVKLRFLDLNLAQEHTTRLTYRPKTTTDDAAEYLLPATNTDREVSHTGRPAPDVRDGGQGEVAAPPQGYTHTTE